MQNSNRKAAGNTGPGGPAASAWETHNSDPSSIDLGPRANIHETALQKQALPPTATTERGPYMGQVMWLSNTMNLQ